MNPWCSVSAQARGTGCCTLCTRQETRRIVVRWAAPRGAVVPGVAQRAQLSSPRRRCSGLFSFLSGCFSFLRAGSCGLRRTPSLQGVLLIVRRNCYVTGRDDRLRTLARWHVHSFVHRLRGRRAGGRLRLLKAQLYCLGRCILLDAVNWQCWLRSRACAALRVT